MQIVIDIPEETYKTISEWKEPNPKYAAEYMLYGFVKNGKRIEQQPCEDAISRQAVLELLNEYDPRLLMRSDYRKMVEDLPSVTQQSDSVEIIKCCVTCKYHHLDGTKDDIPSWKNAQKEPCASCIRDCFSSDKGVTGWERKEA